MDRKSKHNNTGLQKYLDYFRNLLSGKDQHAFEKNIMRNKFEEEAFEGLSQLTADEFSEDITDLQSRIKERTGTRRLIIAPFLRYAAAAVLILSVGITVYFVQQSTKKVTQLAEKHIEKDTSVDKKTSMKPAVDTLEQKIAYIPETGKQTSQERIYDSKPVIREEISSQPEVSTEMTTDIVSTGEPFNDVESELDEMAITRQDIQYEADEVYVEKMVKSDASAKTKSESTRSLKSTGSKYASPLPVSSEINIVTGRVLSAADETPLPGVTVMLKGTTTGTVSDTDGNFRIQVPVADSSVLQFAYIGYTTEELEVGNLNDVTVTLNEDLVALEEVVVVGYGTTKRTNVTGAVVSVQAEEESVEVPILIPPKPADGFPAYRQYIRENTDYDKLPEFDKSVIVKLSFEVGINGKISRIAVKKSAGHAFDQEAIRLIKEGPSWNPGTEDGISVTKEVTLKIRFEPEDKPDN